MPNILFICTANRIRSPMAVALFRDCLAAYYAPEAPDGWQVHSAGTWAAEGRPAMPLAQAVLAEEFNLDLSGHTAREVRRVDLESSDLILTMERSQMEALRVEFPALAGRVFMLSEMAGWEEEVADPIGQARPAYLAAARQIDRLLADGFQRILALVGINDQS